MLLSGSLSKRFKKAGDCGAFDQNGSLIGNAAELRNVLNKTIIAICGRCGGLVVSALDSGSRGPGSSPGRVIVLCSCEKHFTLTVPLSTH